MSQTLSRPGPREFATVDGSDLFDRRAMTIGSFTFRSRSAVAIGKPSIEGWSTALEFACATHASSPYWIGDLMAHAETRSEWREKLSQAVSITGLAHQTLTNLGWVSRHVEEPERQLSPSLAHSAEVGSLERPEQVKWLGKARAEGWTVRELRGAIKHARKTTILDGRADSLYTVDVSVIMTTVEAETANLAEQKAWDEVKVALAELKGRAKVIAVHARAK